MKCCSEVIKEFIKYLDTVGFQHQGTSPSKRGQ